MARPSHITFPGVFYHVTSRGNGESVRITVYHSFCPAAAWEIDELFQTERARQYKCEMLLAADVDF